MSDINSKFNACMFKADCMKNHEYVNRLNDRITQLETELADRKIERDYLTAKAGNMTGVKVQK